ncbi:MAG: hypothetical protein H6544_06400 [Prevotellaceae bacterium]|nr:hypothetical protein [Prevotellaceae bacterium]
MGFEVRKQNKMFEQDRNERIEDMFDILSWDKEAKVKENEFSEAFREYVSANGIDGDEEEMKRLEADFRKQYEAENGKVFYK